MTWTQLKDKFAEALVNIVFAGVILAGGFGILEAYLADFKRDRMKDEILQRLVDNHNDAVKREGEIMEKITKLEAQLAKRSATPVPTLPTFPSWSPNNLPTLPTGPMGSGIGIGIPDQLNPAQTRLDWMNSNTQRYKKE